MSYLEWRDLIAIPYLEENYERVCAKGCGERNWLDVGHKRARSTNPELRMELSNVEWQCVPFNRFGQCNR